MIHRTPEFKTYEEHVAWKSEVRRWHEARRNLYVMVCRVCGKKACILHHVIYVKELTAVMPVCGECHRLIHFFEISQRPFR